MNWDSIVADLGPRLYKYFACRSDLAEADDRTQETLLRLYKKVKLGDFQPDRASLSTFAYGIAFNINREMERSKMKHASLSLEENDMLGGEDGYHRVEKAIQLRRAIAYLNEWEREVIVLYLDKSLGLSEIAVVCELPLNTVKSHLHRAKKKLIEVLN